MTNALIIEKIDNVAVAIETLKPGMEALFYMPDGSVETVEILENIPIYHKFSIRDIATDEPIIKYGEHIGFGGCNIKKGQHVHVHNVISRRENLKL